MFWMLYAFFWVIPRRQNFECRRFGTLCSIFIGGQSIPKRRHIKFRRRGITQKKAYNKDKLSIILSYMHMSWVLTNINFREADFLSSFIKALDFRLEPLRKSQFHVRGLWPVLSKRPFCVGTLTLVKSNGFSFRRIVWEETYTLDNTQIDSHVYQLL